MMLEDAVREMTMRVLVFAPHRDDEILGVGGTILKRKAAGAFVAVCLVTAREGEVLPECTMRIHREMLAAHRFCEVDQYVGLPFGANRLEEYPRVEFNQAFTKAVSDVCPDEVYVPFWGDMQRDHRLTTEAALVALRAKTAHAPRRIYAYETLSETGIGAPTAENAFSPNVFEDITDYLEGKRQALRFFESQMHPFPDPRSLEAVEALARFRGATANVGAAEAFMLVREVR